MKSKISEYEYLAYVFVSAGHMYGWPQEEHIRLMVIGITIKVKFPLEAS